MKDFVSRNASSLYLGLGGLALLAYYTVPAVRGNGVLFNLIGLSSSIAIVIGVRKNKPSSKIAWQLFALGQIFFVTGDAFYYGYNALFGADVPFPSLGDLFYLSVYPSLIAGLLIIIRRRSPGGNRASLIDALILTVGLAVVAWTFLMAPYAHDAVLTLLEKLVSIAYPLMDVCLLAVAIRLAVDGGLRRPSLRMMVLSIVALLTTDAILGVLTLNGGYNEGGFLDAGWAAYYLLWGAAALHGSMKELDAPVPHQGSRLSWGRLGLLTAASLMASGVRIVQLVRGVEVDEPVLIGTSVALFSLVIARMSGLLNGSERAAGRERSLREAARDLVSASRRDEVVEATIDSLHSLVADADVRVAVLTHNGELQARARVGADVERWPLRASEFTSLDAETLRSRGLLEVDLDGVELRQGLRLDAKHKLVIFPLFVRQQLRGLVFVASEKRLSPEMQSALQTLSVQAALALESAILSEEMHQRESEQRFSSLVQHSSDLIVVIEPDTTVKYVSPSVQRSLGYEVEEMTGARFADYIHMHDIDLALSAIIQRPEVEQPTTEAFECRFRHANGTWLHFEILVTNLMGVENVNGIVLNARDVSERKAFESQLRHQAFHDPVTNLANRALFTDRVEHALARMTRDHGGIAVLFIDLDDFKVINDSLGHAAGDDVLLDVGKRLSRSVRTMDTVARFGGDEFAVLLEDTYQEQELAEIADRTLKSLHGAIVIDDKEVFISASMGIAVLDAEEAMTSAADEILRNADVAMYMAKREGKGRYCVFEPEMHASVVHRLELKGALQRALERGELELYYQPIMTLDPRRVTGFEALARWHHPERGPIPPVEFIPVAEETGLINQLGRWVLNQACRHARFLQDMFPAHPPLTMSVNLSVKQLQGPTLVEDVAVALEESGLEPSSLTLEITESVLVTDTDATIVKLHALKELGIKLAVDDFGTGYSSLSYLSRFPVDALKIDRSFVTGIDNDVESSALAAAIVKIGETLKLHTIAEGIEMEGQLACLQNLGCALGQGFLFAPPMDLDKAVEYLSPLFAASDVPTE
ncbi:MAG: putative bifunctional diguanylate cyclase/phosphodiesterase [Actinomycetota bacterium]